MAGHVSGKRNVNTQKLKIDIMKVTKFVKEGPDEKGRTHIIQVDEDKANNVRNVIKFICEVQSQQTEEETQMTADLIVDNLNTDLAIKQSRLGKHESKFENGTPVIVNNQFMAIVFSSYNMFDDERYIIYKVIADANEIAHRVRNKNYQDFEVETDKELYDDDYNSLLFETDQVCILEVPENELRRY